MRLIWESSTNKWERAIANIYAIALVLFVIMFGLFCSLAGAFISAMVFNVAVPGAAIGGGLSAGAVAWVFMRHRRLTDG